MSTFGSLMSGGGPSTEKLKEARDWCAKEFKKRYNEYDGHASFLASKILEEADTKFALGSHGVEGFSSKTGSTGHDYLNYGDPYDATIVVRTKHNSATFMLALGGWAPYA